MSSGCNDKKIRQMLHLYELGVLNENEQREVEEHLLGCAYCSEEVEKFQKAARLMKSDKDIRTMVGDFVETSDDVRDTDRKTSLSSIRSRLNVLLPSSALVIAVVLVLVLMDWKFEISPRHEVVAAENRLAVMYFQNTADPGDPDRLSEIVANLLITDLSESQYMEVISNQRIFDILRVLGLEGKKHLDREHLSTIAEKARARWMLLGNILQVEPQLVITSQLVELPEGQVRASQRITGQENEDIFSVIDSLTILIKKDLALPEAALQEMDPSIADVTTTSIEAYRYYLEGIENLQKFYNNDAIQSFHKALEYDSTLAMAYYYLTGLENRRLISEAVKYVDGVSFKEQMYIRSRAAQTERQTDTAISILHQLVERYPEEKDALLTLGLYAYHRDRFQDAINYYNRTIEIDPLNKSAYNMLSFSYEQIDDLDSAFWANDKYIELASNEPNPYDSRGDLYTFCGRLEDATRAFQRAVEVKPDFHFSLEKLAHLYVFQREYGRADSIYKRLQSWDVIDIRSSAGYCRAYIPIHQGKFSRALQLLDASIELDHANEYENRLCSKHRMKAIIYDVSGNWTKALEEITNSIEISSRIYPDDGITYRLYYIYLLARNGQIDHAMEVADSLKSRLDAVGESPALYHFALGLVRWIEGDIKSSVGYIDRYMSTASKREEPHIRYFAGRIYLEAGRLADAVTMFEQFLTWYDCSRLYWGTLNVETHYYLGRAYEESRWYDRAIEQYEQFLELWKDIDRQLPTIADAKERLSRLKSQP